MLAVAGQAKGKVAEYETKIGLLSQEVERLNSVVESKNSEIKGLKGMFDKEIQEAQESLRLSANQNSKLAKELSDYRDKLGSNDQQNEVLKAKIQKLLQENTGLADEVRNAQENVRLSNAQQSKAFKELQEYKLQIESNNSESENIRRKMQNLVKENQALGEEVRNAQENLRLSANQIAKLNS